MRTSNARSFIAANPIPIMIMLALICIIGIALTAFILPDLFSNISNGVKWTVGLGIVPLSVWAIALAFVSIRHERLNRWNLWGSALILIVGLIGVFSFWWSTWGALGWFMLDKDATLGGNLGKAIIGGGGWLTASKLFGVFLLALIVALPALFASSIRPIFQGLAFIYMSVFMFIGSLFSRRREPELEPMNIDSGAPILNSSGAPILNSSGISYQSQSIYSNWRSGLETNEDPAETHSNMNLNDKTDDDKTYDDDFGFGQRIAVPMPEDEKPNRYSSGTTPSTSALLNLRSEPYEPDGEDEYDGELSERIEVPTMAAADAVTKYDEDETDTAMLPSDDDDEQHQPNSVGLTAADEPVEEEHEDASPVSSPVSVITADTEEDEKYDQNGFGAPIFVPIAVEEATAFAPIAVEEDAVEDQDEDEPDADEDDLDIDLRAEVSVINAADAVAADAADEDAADENDYDEKDDGGGGDGEAPAFSEPIAVPTMEDATQDYDISDPAANPNARKSNGTRQPKANRYWDLPSSEAVVPSMSPRAGGRALMWQRPSIDIFREEPENPITEEELQVTANTITQTLSEYGIESEVEHIRPGPTVTMYGLAPGWIRKTRIAKELDDEGQPLRDERGRQRTKRVEQKTRVKVDSILAREKDLALALMTPSIRIETPVMGKSLIGIEVPNPNPSRVTLRSVMESTDFEDLRPKAHLPIALGRASGGETVSFDLAKMPHLLVAGATGSGKSVCLNAIVSCLITEKTPAEMRLLLVDPKRVELTPYNGIPHLMAPVIVETDTVVGYLKGLIREMFERYRRMEEVGVRNIEAYNKRMPDKMPFLCVVVDELADLMMTAAFDVEQSLCRLAQLGRATGIHLIIATQRPSVDVVTGLIKANFPSRISFGVTSQVDSRTILDTAGADKLLGRGDMLYLPLDASKPSRVQNVFVGDQEIESLVNFWKTSPWASLPEIDLLGGEDSDDSAGADTANAPDRDDLIDKAIELAISNRKMSTSLLQRRLRIGYPRAARLMDQLEDEGIVGPPGDGSKSRDVIINQ